MKDMKAAMKEAIEDAIRTVGMEQFKKTSLFMSNERATKAR